jgi:ParB/RepB/Spo0J family partition protein
MLKSIALGDIKVLPQVRTFTFGDIQTLANLIKAGGTIHPVTVRPSGDGEHPRFTLVAGERRYRAAQLLGLGSIPAIVQRLGDDEARFVQLQENLGRSDLSWLEIGAATSEWLAEGMSAAEISRHLGREESGFRRLIRAYQGLHPLVLAEIRRLGLRVPEATALEWVHYRHDPDKQLARLHAWQGLKAPKDKPKPKARETILLGKVASLRSRAVAKGATAREIAILDHLLGAGADPFRSTFRSRNRAK